MIRDPEGQIITGKEMALNREKLVQTWIDRGCWVLKVEEALRWSWKVKLAGAWSRPRERESILFFQQMATLTKARVPVRRSLQILHSQASVVMNPILDSILADVERGVPLWQALDNRGPVFSPVGVQMIRSGEWSGSLGETLERLTDYMKKQQQFGKQVRSASLYPGLLASFLLVVLIFIIAFIVPRITTVLGPAAHLPPMTVWLMSCAGFLSEAGVFLFLGFLAFIMGGFWWRQTPSGRVLTDGLLLNIPVVGKIIHKIVVARITGSLGILLKSGLTIMEALTMAEKLAYNVTIRQAIANVRFDVSRGTSLAAALLRHGFFHMMEAQMVAVGEETGLMAEALSNAAEYYEGEAQAAVSVMVTLLEPMLILIMALVVGFITIGCILPMLDVMTIF
ncbi:MAG: type II secretion system F family protein [Syntrophomonadaceae bacterium]|nr:type II secretion system F family protein [Syntrophomonadaceae bacterium]